MDGEGDVVGERGRIGEGAEIDGPQASIAADDFKGDKLVNDGSESVGLRDANDNRVGEAIVNFGDCRSPLTTNRRGPVSGMRRTVICLLTVLLKTSEAMAVMRLVPSARGMLRSKVPLLPMPTSTLAGPVKTAGEAGFVRTEMMTDKPMNPLSMSPTRPATMVLLVVRSEPSVGKSR